MKLIDRIDNYLEDKEYKMIYKENSLNIINYSEILDFSSTKIELRYQDKIINIMGNNLVISKMEDNEILIIGNIMNINL